MEDAIHIYELRCPSCGEPLSGISTDRVFGCPSCAIAVSAVAGKLQQTPIFVAESLVPWENAPLVHLPFWRHQVNTTVHDGRGKDITASTLARSLHSVWVAAFYETRPSYFGNPGLNLTLAKIPDDALLSVAGQSPLVVGAARREIDAAPYVYPFVAGLLDREKDISGFQIDVSVQTTQLWAIPFAFDTSACTVQELMTGIFYPCAMVECFDEICQFHRIALPNR